MKSATRPGNVTNKFDCNDSASNLQKGLVFHAMANCAKPESFVKKKWQFHNQTAP